MATYSLANDRCRVAVNTHGAELASFQRLLGEPNDALECLWPADPAHWGRHAPVLFPVVGRLPQDTYLHQGRAYRLPQHGFARDRDFQLVGQTAAALEFELRADDASRAVYPFDFVLRIAYELREATLTVRWRVHNPDPEAELLFSIGAHPAFRCPLEPGERFEDYYFEFDHPVAFTRQLLREGLRTGETAPVPLAAGGRELPLSAELFADDALVLAHYDFTRLTLRARQAAHGVRVSFPGFPYLGLWTKTTAAGAAPFVCIEPWHGVASSAGPPQELADKEGILTLAPGQEFATEYNIELLS